ncbi:G-protein coupled receptor 37-like [Trichinella pseudospiralis]
MNRHALRDPIHRKVYWLTRGEAKDGVCRPVKGPPYHFKLRDGVVPSAVKSIVGSVNCEIWLLQYHCNSILPRLRPVEGCPSILFTNSC